MSLRSYDEARPWAKAIARNVEDHMMPPWDADPGYGPWKNDRSLEPGRDRHHRALGGGGRASR